MCWYEINVELTTDSNKHRFTPFDAEKLKAFEDTTAENRQTDSPSKVHFVENCVWC